MRDLLLPVLGSSMLVIGQISGLPEVFSATTWNLGAYGILGWYLWYNVRHTIPSIVKDFRDEMKLVRDDAQSNREAFNRNEQANREAFNKALQELKAK